jgi:hypothetical protein
MGDSITDAKEKLSEHIHACIEFLNSLPEGTQSMKTFTDLQNSHSTVMTLGRDLMPPLQLPGVTNAFPGSP